MNISVIRRNSVLRSSWLNIFRVWQLTPGAWRRPDEYNNLSNLMQPGFCQAHVSGSWPEGVMIKKEIDFQIEGMANVV
jgi:hypothetical protein